jgi:hypothetical protein
VARATPPVTLRWWCSTGGASSDAAGTPGLGTSVTNGPYPRSLGDVPSRYDVTRSALATQLEGEPRYRVDQVCAALYDQMVDPVEMTTLPKALRAPLDRESLRSSPRGVGERQGHDHQVAVGLEGGARVETVLMLYPDRATVCVSSQAGCAMGCGFCAPGKPGSNGTSRPARSSSRSCGRAAGTGDRSPSVERRVYGDG